MCINKELCDTSNSYSNTNLMFYCQLSFSVLSGYLLFGRVALLSGRYNLQRSVQYVWEQCDEYGDKLEPIGENSWNRILGSCKEWHHMSRPAINMSSGHYLLPDTSWVLRLLSLQGGLSVTSLMWSDDFYRTVVTAQNISRWSRQVKP